MLNDGHWSAHDWQHLNWLETDNFVSRDMQNYTDKVYILYDLWLFVYTAKLIPEITKRHIKEIVICIYFVSY